MAPNGVKTAGVNYWNHWRKSFDVVNVRRGLSNAEEGISIHRVFHALGDPTLRKIVEKVSERPVSVSQLAAPLAISLAAMVQHLLILEESKLVRTEKIGRVRTCRVDPMGLSVVEQWVRDRRSVWESRFDQLGELLVEPDGSSASTSIQERRNSDQTDADDKSRT